MLAALANTYCKVKSVLKTKWILHIAFISKILKGPLKDQIYLRLDIFPELNIAVVNEYLLVTFFLVIEQLN